MQRDRGSFFYVSSIDVSEGQPYGDWVISWEDHATLWDQLSESGELNLLSRKYRADYALLPRGRVSFNKKTALFTVYHGNWMNVNHTQMILDRFNLDPSLTILENDRHYKI